MLDLVRLSPKRLFPPGGPELYRQIARLTDLAPGAEVLDVACGKGVTLEFFVREYDVVGTGVDTDPTHVQSAEAFAREDGLTGRMSFQVADSDDLPFRDRSFDLVVGELGMAARSDPREAIRELVRVLRPGGKIVLVQLVWKARVEESRKAVLAAHLGARPLMLVELRQTLTDAGIGSIHAEDWTDEDTAFRAPVRKPFPDFAELFSVREKLGILRRAWGRWGWGGVKTVFEREVEVHRLLTRERLLALSLVRGEREPGAPQADLGVARRREDRGRSAREEGRGATGGGPRPGDHWDEEAGEGELTEESQTAGLPLFGSNGESDHTPG
jgi:SAM-dependent methyltransferase